MVAANLIASTHEEQAVAALESHGDFYGGE